MECISVMAVRQVKRAAMVCLPSRNHSWQLWMARAAWPRHLVGAQDNIYEEV